MQVVYDMGNGMRMVDLSKLVDPATETRRCKLYRFNTGGPIPDFHTNFDIQYMVTGDEMFGVCKRDGLKEIDRIDENDVVFYSDPDLYGQVLLREGDLIVVAPEDAHKPRCAAGAPAPVKKVVVKVKI